MKKLLSGGMIALGSIALLKRMKRKPAIASGQPSQEAMLRYVTTFIIPLWTAAGLSDYLCHRRTSIEKTSGTKESIFHLLMMIEGGPMVLAGLFLEMNAGALALMTGAAALHEATVVWDFNYAADKRPSLPIEQHTHSFLEVLPLSLLAFAAATHWDQFAALFGFGEQRANFRLRFKHPPLPIPGLLGLMAALVALVGLPHCEELLRCLAAEKRGEKGADTPACLPEMIKSFAS